MDELKQLVAQQRQNPILNQPHCGWIREGELMLALWELWERIEKLEAKCPA